MNRRFLGLIFSLCVVASDPVCCAVGEQAPSPPPPATSPSPPPPGSTWQSPKVPTKATLEELRVFIVETKALQPTSHPEYLDMMRAVREASLKILQGSKDHSTPAFKEAEFDYVSSSVMLLGNENEDAPRLTFERFREYLKSKKKLAISDVQMCLMAGQNMEQLSDRELVREAYSSFADIVESKEDSELESFVAIFRANLKRLDLPGTQIQLSGTALGGTEVSIESMKGKIVLIHLFASWSQPSVAEFPVVLKCYEQYRDKGLEVVGISLDQEEKVLTQFLQKLNVPWKVLWDGTTPGTHPFVSEYGFMILPTVILVDRQGIVQGIEAGTRSIETAIQELLQADSPQPEPMNDPIP